MPRALLVGHRPALKAATSPGGAVAVTDDRGHSAVFATLQAGFTRHDRRLRARRAPSVGPSPRVRPGWRPPHRSPVPSRLDESRRSTAGVVLCGLPTPPHGWRSERALGAREVATLPTVVLRIRGSYAHCRPSRACASTGPAKEQQRSRTAWAGAPARRPARYQLPCPGAFVAELDKLASVGPGFPYPQSLWAAVTDRAGRESTPPFLRQPPRGQEYQGRRPRNPQPFLDNGIAPAAAALIASLEARFRHITGDHGCGYKGVHRHFQSHQLSAVRISHGAG